MKNDCVDEELEKQLPKAGKLFRIEFSSYWWIRFFQWVLWKRNSYGVRIQRPKFYFISRGANFQTYYFGPITVIIRKRWLLLSAQSLYPHLFKTEKIDEQ